MRQSILFGLAVLLFCSYVSQVAAHNHLIWPTPRDTRGTYAGDNNCENGNGNFPGGSTFQRGQEIKPRWSYNNHRGGFVRFSIVPMGSANNGGIFNRAENIVHYACHNQNCAGAGVRFDPGDTIPCTTSLRIPSHLKDGNYVFQWVVYSMFDSDGNPNKGLPNYLSCANIKIQGGALSNNQPGKCSFTWAGGDKEYTRTKKGNHAADTCVYFMRNTLGKAWETVKIDGNLIKINGRPAEVEACLRNGGVGQNGGGAPAGNNNNDRNDDNNNNGGNNQGNGCSKYEEYKNDFYCYKMAEHNGISLDQLMALNPGLNCWALNWGQKVCVRR